LRATTELWDRLLQEFLLFLRANASAQDGDAVAAVAANAETEAATAH